MVLTIPRDRNSEFEPQLVPKGSRMNDRLDEAIIGMYRREWPKLTFVSRSKMPTEWRLARERLLTLLIALLNT